MPEKEQDPTTARCGTAQAYLPATTPSLVVSELRRRAARSLPSIRAHGPWHRLKGALVPSVLRARAAEGKKCRKLWNREGVSWLRSPSGLFVQAESSPQD